MEGSLGRTWESEWNQKLLAVFTIVFFAVVVYTCSWSNWINAKVFAAGWTRALGWLDLNFEDLELVAVASEFEDEEGDLPSVTGHKNKRSRCFCEHEVAQGMLATLALLLVQNIWSRVSCI